MKYTGAELTIKMLERHGIEFIAGIPGGTNLPLYTALNKSEKIKHILTRHEQGAGFIAQGMARSTGKPAVCFATSGPGATNIMTAIADAKGDSVPIIIITGQVPLSLIGTDAFQEVDAYGMTIPITKHNFLIRDVEEIPDIVNEAFRIAVDGRPGPVLIDIPKDIQAKQVEIESIPETEKSREFHISSTEIEEIAEIINSSEKPMLYIGGGIISADASEEIRQLAEKNSIPVCLTLMGLGAFPADHKLYLGMLGMHGARYTNYMLNEADLILAFGVRFDDRATGNVAKFCPNARIVHIDIDKAEINKIKKSHYSIRGNIKPALQMLIPNIHPDKRKSWIEFMEKTKSESPFIFPAEDDQNHPINILKYISETISDDDIITTDVGQHQMWTAQVYPFKKPRTLLTSGGLGTMGFGLPAAIGAAAANPEKRVVCISGDGSIMMNIQELATLAELNLNVKIFIFNNGHLGLVRQQQQLFYQENYIATRFAKNPDLCTIARGFGIQDYQLNEGTNIKESITEIFKQNGPCLINVPIGQYENVLPMVPPGAGNHEMIGG